MERARVELATSRLQSECSSIELPSQIYATYCQNHKNLYDFYQNLCKIVPRPRVELESSAFQADAVTTLAILATGSQAWIRTKIRDSKDPCPTIRPPGIILGATGDLNSSPLISQISMLTITTEAPLSSGGGTRTPNLKLTAFCDTFSPHQIIFSSSQTSLKT